MSTKDKTSNSVLKSGAVPFRTESRLLQELGLRLVASPEVALVELIKNAYDADSETCHIGIEEHGKATQLVISDSGTGMTLDDFLNRWMQIATSSKAKREFSEKYERKMTGAKGIGRFAVRYLGDHLVLESTAYDSSRKRKTVLRATFDWPKLDRTTDLARTKIPYRLFEAPSSATTGTRLVVSNLRSSPDFVRSRELRAEILRIVSPLSGLESGHILRQRSKKKSDPGFEVILPGDTPSEDKNLADLVLKNHWARLTVSLKKTRLVLSVEFPGLSKPKTKEVKVRTHISSGLFADIRFFPRRKGVFSAKEVNGTAAWRWIRDNSGVAVVDHGFRIKPYGFQDDDWLSLDIDGAHNERNWRSKIARKEFPIPEAQRPRPGENPALNLPHNSQLVGAVFVECSRPSDSPSNHDLFPAMDREGLLSNEGFKELQEYIRAGIEYLALCDKKEMVRQAALEARRKAKEAREDIQEAIAEIESNENLASVDRSRIVKQYISLADQLDEQEEYAAAARRNLTTMSLLGVVAGYMTHESDAMLHELSEANTELKKLSRKHPSLKETQHSIERRLKSLSDYVRYSKLFIGKVGSSESASFRAYAQVQHVKKHFQAFADERQIAIKNEVPRNLDGPPIPLTVYSGILLNLLTNALKAVSAVKGSVDAPQVVFRSWNEAKTHFIEVLDNGVGIPPQMRKRIWEPLYTTTSEPGNPLGSGMGLGLTLVKQVASEFGGKVSLIHPPPPSFSTCFRVTFPAS